MDWRVLGFTLGVSVLTGILFGLFPAFSASRTDLNSSLKESSNRSGTGFRQGKARALAGDQRGFAWRWCCWSGPRC